MDYLILLRGSEVRAVQNLVSVWTNDFYSRILPYIIYFFPPILFPLYSGLEVLWAQDF